MAGTNFRLNSLALSLRVLITCLVLALAVGYFVSVLQVISRTDLNLEKTVTHYRGSEADALLVPQSYATMLSVAHVHSFSQPVVLALIGFLFALSGASERNKIFWILATFLGSLLSNAGPWLIRYVSPQFVALLYLAGTAMIGGFVVMAVVILRDVWKGAPHV